MTYDIDLGGYAGLSKETAGEEFEGTFRERYSQTFPYAGRMLKYLGEASQLEHDLAQDTENIKGGYVDTAKEAGLAERASSYRSALSYLETRFDEDFGKMMKGRDRQEREHQGGLGRYLDGSEVDAIRDLYTKMPIEGKVGEKELFSFPTEDRSYAQRKHTEDVLAGHVRDVTGRLAGGLGQYLGDLENVKYGSTALVPYEGKPLALVDEPGPLANPAPNLPAPNAGPSQLPVPVTAPATGPRPRANPRTGAYDEPIGGPPEAGPGLGERLKDYGKGALDLAGKGVGAAGRGIESGIGYVGATWKDDSPKRALNLYETSRILGETRDVYYQGILKNKARMQEGINRIDELTPSTADLLFDWF